MAVRVDMDERWLLDVLEPDGFDLVRDSEVLYNDDYLGSEESSNRPIIRAGIMSSLPSRGFDPELDGHL